MIIYSIKNHFPFLKTRFLSYHHICNLEEKLQRDSKIEGREKSKEKTWMGKGEMGCFLPFKETDTFLLLYSSGQPLCTQRHPGNDKESWDYSLWLGAISPAQKPWLGCGKKKIFTESQPAASAPATLFEKSNPELYWIQETRIVYTTNMKSEKLRHFIICKSNILFRFLK